MKGCLLCLQNHVEQNYISVQSLQWFQLNIPSIIAKHFWPIENLQHTLGLCLFCWKQLYDFHKFYLVIDEAHHKHKEIVTDQQTSLDSDIIYDEDDDITVDMKPTIEYYLENEKIQEQTILNASPITLFNFAEEPHIKIEKKEEVENERMDDILLTNERIPINFIANGKDSNRPEHLQIVPIMLCNENVSIPVTSSFGTNNSSEQNNVDNMTLIKPRNKRGRPRKIRDMNEMLLKPVGKRGRPRKYITENGELFRHSHEFVKRKQKSFLKARKRGRPRKKFKIDDNNKSFAPKGKRGRPRKIQINESDCKKIIREPILTTELEFIKQNSFPQPVALSEDMSLNSRNDIQYYHTSSTSEKELGYGTKELVYKKHKSLRMVKKRKRLQQHNLIRNYITTSVRCVGFKKNDN